MVPIQKDDLSMEDRQKALRYLMFIKEKRDGAVKKGAIGDTPRGVAFLAIVV